MPPSRFTHYQLRTTDIVGARSFYAEVLGSQQQRLPPGLSIAVLPTSAAARGAPAHWLGHIPVEGVEAMAAEIVGRGGQQLGTIQRQPGGTTRVVLRDPFGASLALVSDPSLGAAGPPSASSPVGWHLLTTHDHDRSYAFYAAYFDWVPTGLGPHGADRTTHLSFAWDATREAVGSVANTSASPHIHPQWLFFFRVADLDRASAVVSVRGGKVITRTTTTTGARVAPCEDPQGAAFGLYQSARP